MFLLLWFSWVILVYTFCQVVGRYYGYVSVIGLNGIGTLYIFHENFNIYLLKLGKIITRFKVILKLSRDVLMLIHLYHFYTVMLQITCTEFFYRISIFFLYIFNSKLFWWKNYCYFFLAMMIIGYAVHPHIIFLISG